MEPCTILNLPKIYDIMSEYLGGSDALHMSIRNGLVGKAAKFFLEDDRLMLYEPLGKGKYQVHVYCVSRDSKGKGLRDFAVKTGRWMIDNTDATVFLNFVENHRTDLKLFMRMIGSKRMGNIPGSNEILYISAEGMGIKEDN